MSDIKQLMEHMAEKSYIEHEDVTKCGQCWKEKIKSEVANEFLKANKLSAENLKEMFEEVNRRWQKTSIYLRVQEMLKTGMELEDIRNELLKEGIEI